MSRRHPIGPERLEDLWRHSPPELDAEAEASARASVAEWKWARPYPNRNHVLPYWNERHGHPPKKDFRSLPKRSEYDSFGYDTHGRLIFAERSTDSRAVFEYGDGHSVKRIYDRTGKLETVTYVQFDDNGVVQLTERGYFPPYIVGRFPRHRPKRGASTVQRWRDVYGRTSGLRSGRPAD